MEEERLWKFRKPEWLNSVWARNSGVYGAGGLVCFASFPFSSFFPCGMKTESNTVGIR